MKKKFYDHLIEITTISFELEGMDLSEYEKSHLKDLAHDNIHHTVVDTILSELSDEDKKTFLHHLSKDDHDKVWEHLRDKVENIEEKIKSAAESVKEELHKDIEELKGKK